jgi:hypothetical protein
MQTITIAGTTYTLNLGSAAAEALTRPIKPLRKPALGRTDKRQYPAYVAGVTSTARYVRVYWRLNFVDGAEPSAFFQPLPDTPAAVYQGLDSVEVIE